MDYRKEFDLKTVRESVIELSSKTKELKKARRAIRDDARQGLVARDEAWLLAFRKADGDAFQRGQCARLWGLLYGFIRGMPYHRIENKTRKGNDPSAWLLSRLILEAATDPAVRRPRDAEGALTREQRDLVDRILDDVRAWLSAPVPKSEHARAA